MKSKLPPLAGLLLATFFSLFSFHSLSAQHAYQLKANLDVPLITAGAIGTTTSLILKSNNAPLTLEEIAELGLSDVPDLDQSALDNYSPAFKTASDAFLYASYTFPLLTLALPEIRDDPLTIGIMLGEALMFTETFTGIVKATVSRPRPFTYNPEVPEEIRAEQGNNHSYFSGHTSYAATFSFFTAKVIADNSDNRTVKTIAWTGAILWPAATGYFRYQAGRHFPTDVITGYAVGAAVGYLIPHLHKIRNKPQTVDKSVRLSHIGVGPGSFRAVVVF
jgi:membrane-associated phospholipid phosphatase